MGLIIHPAHRLIDYAPAQLPHEGRSISYWRKMGIGVEWV